MRITRLFALPLLALTAGACTDGAATPATAAPRAYAAARKDGEAVTSVVLPAPGRFTSSPLARGSFADAIDATFRIKLDGGATQVVHVNDPTQMVMSKIAIAPGGALPWHTHPGPAMVIVASGELTLVDSHGCEARPYATGASFMDAGQGHVHAAFNAGAVETTLYVTYLDVPVGTSPLILADAPSC